MGKQPEKIIRYRRTNIGNEEGSVRTGRCELIRPKFISFQRRKKALLLFCKPAYKECESNILPDPFESQNDF